jgi:surfeit locus 1 family protein
MSCLRPVFWLIAAVVPSLVLLVSLGFWQLSRKAEKEAQLASLERSLTAAPTALPPAGTRLADIKAAPVSVAIPATGEVRELTRVTLTGTFIQARSVPVRATLPAAPGAVSSGIGFFWMTPLQTADGTIVFINRGFVPSGSNFRAPAIETPEGPRTITGLMRSIEKPGPFTPADNPAKGDYFTRDPVTMARAVAIQPDKVAPFFVDAEREPDSVRPPIGINPNEMISRIPNNHLQYAGTWFAFAGVLFIIALIFGQQKLAAAAKDQSA